MPRKKDKPDFFKSLINDTEKSLTEIKDGLDLIKERHVDQSRKSLLVDGTIKRFENLFTKVINLLRFALSEEGVETLSPRHVVQEIVKLNWITDLDLWLMALDARVSTINRTSDISQKEYINIISNFTTESEVMITLLSELKAEKAEKAAAEG